jgi:hypothetical protein
MTGKWPSDRKSAGPARKHKNIDLEQKIKILYSKSLTYTDSSYADL